MSQNFETFLLYQTKNVFNLQEENNNQCIFSFMRRLFIIDHLPKWLDSCVLWIKTPTQVDWDE